MLSLYPEMEPVPPYSLDFTVRGYDCGYGGPLRVPALVDFFQEAAWHHAVLLGLGVGHLQDAGRTWMLSRFDLRIDDPPHAGDRVVVETWPMGVERLFAMRDFRMRSADGRTLARAVYAYLIVDLAARRPVRPDRHLAGEFPRSDLPHAIPDPAFDVPGVDSPTLAFRQQAMPRHLDDNGHVNNAHLVGWLADAVPRHLRGAGTPSAVRVTFHREALEGEVLDALWGVPAEATPGRPGVVTELRRGEDVVARAWTGWDREAPTSPS